MIGDILAEVLTGLLGEAIGERLFPRKHEPLPSEGIWNASIGSVAGFLGGLAALFAGTPVIVIVQGRRDEDVPLLIMLAIAIVLAVMGRVAARRTFGVTLRRHRLALVGLWCSTVSLLVGMPTAVFVIYRIVADP